MPLPETDSYSIEIEYLADYPTTIPALAQWLFDEWGYRSPGGTVEGMINTLYERLHRDTLPLALVALREAMPVGTVSLKIREVEMLPQYEHWLGTLYVAKLYRKMGVGSLLVEAAQEVGRKLGIQKLYLYTRDAHTQRLYQKLGWMEVERLEYGGRLAVIMKTDLDA